MKLADWKEDVKKVSSLSNKLFWDEKLHIFCKKGTKG